MIYQGKQYYLHGLGPFTPFYSRPSGGKWLYTSSDKNQPPTTKEIEDQKIQAILARNQQLR